MDRLDPVAHRGAAGDSQMRGSLRRHRRGSSVSHWQPVECGAGRGFGVDRVGLAVPAAVLPVGSVNFDDVDVMVEEVPGQARTPRSGPFDPHAGHLPVAGQPGEEFTVAGRGRREGSAGDESTRRVDDGGDMHVTMVVDTAEPSNPTRDEPCRPGRALRSDLPTDDLESDTRVDCAMRSGRRNRVPTSNTESHFGFATRIGRACDRSVRRRAALSPCASSTGTRRA